MTIFRLPGISPLAARFSSSGPDAWEVADRAIELEAEGKDIVHLSIGDPDIQTPSFIREAAIAGLNGNRTHYSPAAGENDFRLAVCEHTRATYGKSVTPSRVVTTAGAQSALYATFTTIAGPGTEVILIEPTYITYEGAVQAGGASVVRVPMSSNNAFSLDINRIRAAVTDKTSAILINSPGNPTGTVYSRESMRAVLDLCRERGIWLVSDEVYASLVYDGKHVSPFTEQGSDDHVIVVNSLSKAYAMTGWRIGWIIAPEVVAAAVSDLSQHLLFGVSQFIQDAGAVALRRGDSARAEIRETLRHRRDVLYNGLSQLDGIKVYCPSGGMFLLADVSEMGMDGLMFSNALLDEVGVALIPGFAFGAAARKSVRIGFLSEEDRLKDAINRISTFLKTRLSA